MDLGTVANAARPARSAGTADPRAGAERIALSPRLLLPLLQGQALGNAALAELARDIRSQLAGGERTVTLVLPPGAATEAQAARIDIGGRQFTISPALRDALLAQLGASPSAPGTTLPASTTAATQLVADEAARAWVVSAQTQAATSQLMAGQVALGAGAGREMLRAMAPNATAATRDQALTSIGFDQPVADGAALEAAPVSAVTAIAQRLQQQFERSGLFFESHLAQWTRGARSSDELRAELVQLSRTGTPIVDASAQRVAAQLSVLEQQGVVLTGPAWAGQPMQLVIQREPRKHMAGDTAGDMGADLPPVINARLALDLPHLGHVEVDLRLAGKAIATTVRSTGADDMAAALGQLTDQLSARGLTPVAAQALPLESLELLEGRA